MRIDVTAPVHGLQWPDVVEIIDMTNLAEPQMEQLLISLADRLARQEETTRRLEASLFALARFEEKAETVDVSETPKPGRTPHFIPHPKARRSADALKSGTAEEANISDDILWASAGLIQEALIGFDEMGHVRVWNPAAETLFGWKAEEVIGKPAPFLPDDKVFEHDQLCYDARNEKPCHDIHTVRKTKSGHLIRIDLSVAGFRNGVAQTCRLINVPHGMSRIDISAPASELASVIPQDLRLHGLAAIGRQVAAITHDFNNLIQIISGSIESIIDQFEEDDTRRSVLEMTSHATRQAIEVSRGLLNLTRIHPEPNSTCEMTCELSAVVSSHLPVLEGLLGPERSLVTKFTPLSTEIAADPVRIGQVLLNLVSNSRDAMPEGGTFAVEVDVAYDADESHPLKGPVAVLTVSDTGIGMDQETLSHAFDPYFTTKSPEHGTGLGLANVKQIVLEASGVIIPDSSPGTGTTIRIYFPLVTKI